MSAILMGVPVQRQSALQYFSVLVTYNSKSSVVTWLEM